MGSNKIEMHWSDKKTIEDLDFIDEFCSMSNKLEDLQAKTDNGETATAKIRLQVSRDDEGIQQPKTASTSQHSKKKVETDHLFHLSGNHRFK
ncbi:unnamed protein product [Trichobilharzia regenti]|nr:unnamed protein product [Trichobilharzia regenti]